MTIVYRYIDRVYTPTDFPSVTRVIRNAVITDTRPPTLTRAPWKPHRKARGIEPVERARRYLSRVPPAVAGQHGDVHTFRVCCRLVRGFALDEEQSLDVLSEWNGRCQPPWSESELRDKLVRPRRYGREPIGGLLKWRKPTVGPSLERIVASERRSRC